MAIINFSSLNPFSVAVKSGLFPTRPEKQLYSMLWLIFERCHEKTMWFPNKSDTNRSVQSQKIARGWEFCIS